MFPNSRPSALLFEMTALSFFMKKASRGGGESFATQKPSGRAAITLRPRETLDELYNAVLAARLRHVPEGSSFQTRERIIFDLPPASPH